jgi:hypothetical protein
MQWLRRPRSTRRSSQLKIEIPEHPYYVFDNRSLPRIDSPTLGAACDFVDDQITPLEPIIEIDFDDEAEAIKLAEQLRLDDFSTKRLTTYSFLDVEPDFYTTNHPYPAAASGDHTRFIASSSTIRTRKSSFRHRLLWRLLHWCGSVSDDIDDEESTVVPSWTHSRTSFKRSLSWQTCTSSMFHIYSIRK